MAKEAELQRSNAKFEALEREVADLMQELTRAQKSTEALEKAQRLIAKFERIIVELKVELDDKIEGLAASEEKFISFSL
ncbi:hypothetical protein V6N13_046271 [Hibiscus sabdariffa]|uniref:Uncharacterized protein n=2 Tax=Hibiscus sabdariffa TaxID=183260 RepID=A0ABR1ZLU0_9ROSI